MALEVESQRTREHLSSIWWASPSCIRVRQGPHMERHTLVLDSVSHKTIHASLGFHPMTSSDLSYPPPHIHTQSPTSKYHQISPPNITNKQNKGEIWTQDLGHLFTASKVVSERKTESEGCQQSGPSPWEQKFPLHPLVSKQWALSMSTGVWPPLYR